MSPYSFSGYAAPGYHPPQHSAQAYMSPVHPIVMQPVQMHPVLVYPTPPVPHTEYWPEPRRPWPLPKHTSSRQRSEPKAFGAYGCPPPQSKPKDHSRTYGQHRTRPEQSLYPKKAIEYQDQELEANERVFTGSESSSDTLKEIGQRQRSQQGLNKSTRNANQAS